MKLEQRVSKYISSEILAVIERLESNGFSAFIIGGCVRDMLLGIPPKDFDIATDALPSEVVDIFDKAGYKCLEIGKKYGTISVSKTPIKIDDSAQEAKAKEAKNDSPKAKNQTKNMQNIQKSSKNTRKDTNDFVEITTFRKDSAYIDGRHPQRVEFGKSIYEDLSRRDFTINALALHTHKASHKSGGKNGWQNRQNKIIDIYGGLEDLKHKRIACIRNPSERFCEDYLRILRALRFSSVLGFEIEPKTKEAIKKQIQKLDSLPKERVNAEFSKLLLGDFVCEVLSEYSEVLSVIFGECVSTMSSSSLALLKNTPKDLATRLSVLCYGIFAKDFGKEVDCIDFVPTSSKAKSSLKNALKNLRYSNEIISQVCFLVGFANRALAKIHKAGQCQKSLKIALKLLAKECSPNALIAEQKMLALLEFLGVICASKPKIAKAKSSFCQVICQKECFSLSHLAIKGDEVKSILQEIREKEIRQKGQKIDSLSSRRVGEVLDFLLCAVIKEQIQNTKSALKSASKKYLCDFGGLTKETKEEKC